MRKNATEHKEISCKDFRTDCDFKARGKTDSEVMDRCEEHACNSHAKCGIFGPSKDSMRMRIRQVWD